MFSFQSTLGNSLQCLSCSYSLGGKIPEYKFSIFQSNICPLNFQLFSLSCFWAVPKTSYIIAYMLCKLANNNCRDRYWVECEVYTNIWRYVYKSECNSSNNDCTSACCTFFAAGCHTTNWGRYVSTFWMELLHLCHTSIIHTFICGHSSLYQSTLYRRPENFWY